MLIAILYALHQLLIDFPIRITSYNVCYTKLLRLVKYVMEILTLSAILFWFAFAGIKLINGIIHNEISTFREFFQQSVLHNIVIDKKQIRIKEFQILVSYVNEMVFSIHKKNNELKELNASLEEKVLQKTAKLKKQMKFNEELSYNFV